MVVVLSVHIAVGGSVEWESTKARDQFGLCLWAWSRRAISWANVNGARKRTHLRRSKTHPPRSVGGLGAPSRVEVLAA